MMAWSDPARGPVKSSAEPLLVVGGDIISCNGILLNLWRSGVPRYCLKYLHY